MMMLAIDTSSALSSVAVIDDQGNVLAQAEHLDGRGHAEVLAGLVARVLEQVGAVQRDSGAAPIDVVACGVGPGPYTGLRVGITTAQTLGLVWGVPVVGVCSLDAIADAAVHIADAAVHIADAAVRKHGEFVVATDARRSEVYWARYNREGRRTAGPFVNRQSEITDGSGELPWIGEATGALAHAASVGALATVLLAQGEVLGDRVGALSAHGTDDGATSRQLAGQRLLAPYPLYVRRPDAVEPRPSLLQSQGNP